MNEIINYKRLSSIVMLSFYLDLGVQPLLFFFKLTNLASSKKRQQT
jgi:hypothetical protein